MTAPLSSSPHPRPRAVVPQAQVRAALRAEELRLRFHRIISLDDGGTCGVEALVRWQHPQGGLLVPDDFLPAVAHTPVIHEITRWVLVNALAAVRAWPGWTVSVNISALDATRHELVADVQQALRASRVDPRRLVLELTEQAMVQNLDKAIRVLGSVRELGVGLSLDDFGTGYSSLLYLRDLPITEIKIDRTFLSRSEDREENLAIVTSVAQLGRSIGVRVVAEGIETRAQARAARAAGCHYGQGYLWGEPTDADQVDLSRAPAVPERAAARRPRAAVPHSPAAGRIQELLAEGASLHTIAAALNREGLRTDKQTRWTAPSVALVLSRLPVTDPDRGPGFRS